MSPSNTLTKFWRLTRTISGSSAPFYSPISNYTTSSIRISNAKSNWEQFWGWPSPLQKIVMSLLSISKTLSTIDISGVAMIQSRTWPRCWPFYKMSIITLVGRTCLSTASMMSRLSRTRRRNAILRRVIHRRFPRLRSASTRWTFSPRTSKSSTCRWWRAECSQPRVARPGRVPPCPQDTTATYSFNHSNRMRKTTGSKICLTAGAIPCTRPYLRTST